MKHFNYFVLFIIILSNIWTLSSIAQVSEDQNKIWSRVKLEPLKVKEVKTENNWVPAEQVPKFYDIGMGITVFPNFRPHPTTNSTQSETSVDVHPSNNNIVFASANASDWPVSTIYGTGVYWTLNGATTWSGTDNPATLPGFGSNSGDPCSIIGPDGRLYENYISNPGGQGVSVSTNNGANWSTYTVAPNPGSLADKNHYMVDKKAGSPYLNRSYCAWTDFGGTNNYDVVFRYSTNYGQTWSSSINLSNSLSAFNHGVNVQTGPNGEVYATWAVYLGSSNTIEDGIAFAKSTNGGATWSAPVYTYQHTDFGIRGYLSSKGGMRINSFPTMAVDRSGGSNDGNIYICWTQRGVSPAGSDPDIVMVKSTNGGSNWSAPVRVNNDALNNGKDQIFPWCTVDQATGQLMIVFYDSRNVVNSQAEVYIACSLNGGSTFNNFVVSDQSFVLGPISGFSDYYGGDYIGLAAYNNVAYPLWMDSRTGNAQGWMAKVTFGPDDPTNVLATPINSSQINISFTPNANNNNVVVVWNLTGTFTTPSGTPPAIGQPFAGGTLLYNGTSSPVIHSGLNPSTAYYYKLFSYNGTSYSSGVPASATTLNIADPTNVLATAISSSQIDVTFTANANNNNVVVVWNLNGTFTTPTGAPPAIGQPFAGGTLLYNGITSPVNHNGLTPLTTYYYKLFSYNGTNYSPGVNATATTLYLLDFGVNLLVSDNCNNSVQLFFGTAPGATDCYDPGLDVSAPPPPPVGAFDARFSSCGEAWFTDIRGSNPSGERIWDLYYTPATGCSPASFSWNPAQLPSNGYFHLVDPIYGNLVNVNMRTTNHYTDATGLGHLQIKFNYQICSNFNFANGWNMLSLPLDVSNNNYLTLFPNAIPGTLYGYLGTYFSTETVENCTGYWLKFPSSQIPQVCGLDRTECTVALNTGWNMIGGPDCNVPLSSVGDPGGIIIPGTLYGYSGSYFTATSIDGTKGYWIKANASGTITISCGGAALSKPGIELTIPSETLSDFCKIDVSDGSKNNQTLYFNGKLDKSTSIESFSMPPVSPEGSFDARLKGDYRLSESDEVNIQLQTSDYPISVTVTKPSDKNVTDYVLEEIANGVEVGSHNIEDGVKIVISNNKVTMLKITKQSSIPTSYSLEQNYPNPFNPSTTIKFSLPEASNVTLTIYNTLGQKVTELVNTNLEAGRYSYEWDASNVATGMYIYELRTEKFVSMKKMILLK
jgi:hypothetical protein